MKYKDKHESRLRGVMGKCYGNVLNMGECNIYVIKKEAAAKFESLTSQFCSNNPKLCFSICRKSSF